MPPPGSLQRFLRHVTSHSEWCIDLLTQAVVSSE